MCSWTRGCSTSTAPSSQCCRARASTYLRYSSTRTTTPVKCGKTRTIGLAAPYTGPDADVGNQQVRWAKFFVKRWNAKKANSHRKIKVVNGDTQLGVDTAFAVQVAKSFASNSKLLG